MLSVQPKGKQKGCAGCNRKIKDRYLLKALDKYWHEDCLKCACCDCRLGEVGSTLYTKANLILCRRDYLRWATSRHLVLPLREPPSSWAQHSPALATDPVPRMHSPRVCSSWTVLPLPLPCPPKHPQSPPRQGRAFNSWDSVASTGSGQASVTTGTERSLLRAPACPRPPFVRGF